MSGEAMNLRAALEAQMAMINDGIAKSRNPNREGFLVFSHLRQILDQHPDEVTRAQHPNDPHCEDGCRDFEWGEWPGIDGPVLICGEHGRPGPGSAYADGA